MPARIVINGFGRIGRAFPSFGSERTGAPVAAFCRVTGRPIRSHEPISRPDGIEMEPEEV